MKKILVLLGGTSDEREVSLRSGAAVYDSLKNLGHNVTTYDPANGLDGLNDACNDVDLVFPVLHGQGGEDGVIQEILENQDIQFVGSGSNASKLCYDKWLFKKHLISEGVTVANGEIVDEHSVWDSNILNGPFVLKPNDGGSSIDTFIIREPKNINKAAILDAFARHKTMLLEELISGIETTVAVIGSGDSSKALPMVEIIPPANQEFDYENKYNGATQELCPPKNVSSELQTKAAELAVKMHKSSGCEDISRTDIIISDDNTLFVLETNTIPGMTNQSLVPKSAQAAGMSMDNLIAEIISRYI